jgi:hypothetical protein
MANPPAYFDPAYFDTDYFHAEMTITVRTGWLPGNARPGSWLKQPEAPATWTDATAPQTTWTMRARSAPWR